MSRAEMDALCVGDSVEVRTYSILEEDYVWVQTKIERIDVKSSSERYSHGGKHQVFAYIGGFLQPLDPELTRKMEV